MYRKILGLGALALTSLMAFAGTASATTLTSPSGTIYTGTEHYIAEQIHIVSPFIGTVACNKGTIHKVTESHGSGVTASGKIRELTFSECTGAMITSPVAKPGSVEIHGTSTTGNGTVTSNGAEIIFHNTLAGSCTYVTSNTDLGTLTGSNVTGGNATLDVNAVLVRTGGSGFCGEGATWTGSYKLTTPATLEVH